MAIALDATSASPATASGASLTWSHTVGAALSNGVLIVGFLDNSGGSPSGVTYNGVAMTPITGIPGANGLGVAHFFILLNPAAGAHNVVVTNAGSTAGDQMAGFAASYSGVKQSTTVDAVSPANAGSGTAATAPITTVAAGAWIVSFAYGAGIAAVTIAVGSGLTARSSTIVLSTLNAIRLADSAATVATGAHTANWTFGGGGGGLNWSLEAFSLAPASSAAAVLAGAIAGSAAVAGALTLPGRAVLAGAIAGAAGVAGALTQAPPGATLAGPIAATSTSSGVLTIYAGLAGSIAGHATIAGQLAGTALLSGAIAGSAAVAGALTQAPPGATFAGPIAGSAAVAGALTISAGLAGAIAGHATTAGALTTSAALVGAIAGTSTAAGTLKVRAGLAGAIAGHASLSGSLKIDAGGPLPVLIEFRGTIFYSDGTIGVSAWYPITCDVFGLGWQRGSSAYRGVFMTPDPSQADVYLYDYGMSLDPTNTTGPWYGQFDVGAELRISMGLVDFYGRITDISHEMRPAPDPALAPVPVAHLSALDPQGRASTVDLPTSGPSAEEEETSGARIARLVAWAAIPGTHAINTGGLLMAGGTYWPATDVWSMIVDVMQNELGSLEWLPTPTYSSLRTHTRDQTWPATPPATVLDLGCHAGAIPIYSARSSAPSNTVRNQVLAGRGGGRDTVLTQWDDGGSSQAKYGLRPTTKADLQFRLDTDRDAWAVFVLTHNAYPLQTWTLETRPNRAAQVAAIESTPLYVSWARVTIDQGLGAPMDRAMRVLGVNWSIDANAAGVCEITVGYEIPRPPQPAPP